MFYFIADMVTHKVRSEFYSTLAEASMAADDFYNANPECISTDIKLRT